MSICRGILLYVLFWMAVAPCDAKALSPVTDAEIRTILKDWVDTDKLEVGMVVGLVDESGTRVIGYGKLGNGTDQEVDGDTLFCLGSITKVFTALLLQDLVEQGLVHLDDPAQKYLPDSFKMPTYNGKPITLLHLATHTSGLPRDENGDTATFLSHSSGDTATFLSHCKLTRAPGTKWEYSNFGIGLLAQIITQQAGKDYETLVLERICRPLGMNSTRLHITSELKPRLAGGYVMPGHRVLDGGLSAGGVGGLHSTVNDMLKFIAAYAGIAPSPLSPLMDKARALHKLESGEQRPLVWFGSDPIYEHGGLVDGFQSEMAFDRKRRRGIIILSNCIFCQTALSAICGPLLRGNSSRPGYVTPLTPHLLSRYVGTYRNEKGTGLCFVRQRGERLVFQSSAEPLDQPRFGSYEMFPISDSVFRNDFFRAQAVFCEAANGQPEKMVLGSLDSADRFQLVRVSSEAPEALDPFLSNPQNYEACVGQYRTAFLFGLIHLGPTLSISHTTDALGDHLFGEVRGYTQKIEFFPKDETNFVINPCDTNLRLSFVRKRSGKTKAVLVYWNGKKLHGSRISDTPLK